MGVAVGGTVVVGGGVVVAGQTPEAEGFPYLQQSTIVSLSPVILHLVTTPVPLFGFGEAHLFPRFPVPNAAVQEVLVQDPAVYEEYELQ